MFNRAFSSISLVKTSNNQEMKAPPPAACTDLTNHRNMHLFIKHSLPSMNTGYLSFETEAIKKYAARWACHRWQGFYIGSDHKCTGHPEENNAAPLLYKAPRLE